MSVTTNGWCGDCHATQVFERPVDFEPHDADGPELICTVCGGGWVELATFEVAVPAVKRAVA
jgi:hypothetical protein